MFLGHQPFIFDRNHLYYCISEGTRDFGAEWRVSLNGVRVGGGAQLFEGGVLECNPHVSKRGDLYRLSFVVRPAIGAYRLVIVDSLFDDFREIVFRYDVVIKCFSAFADFDYMYQFETTMGMQYSTVVLQRVSLRDASDKVNIEAQVFSSMATQGLYLYRITRDPSTQDFIATVYKDESNYDSFIFDFSNGGIKNRLLNKQGKSIYKCHRNEGILAYAEKIGAGFEDRAIVVEYP